ncbi:MAG TPA: aminotransferase class I/II-fold pyridoxal phosphate-dependent enzyme, partial [Phnomibacter sp.]|nr:aminotransferase class I/II-fold pyridoxal phosphate-dependent enzyme [Phnomibacter sp.]
MYRTDTIPNRTLEVDGRPYLYFGGTSYLGLPTHAGFQQLVMENLRRFGTAWGSSRQANVQLTAYDAGEAYLSGLTGLQAALTISSGMLAGKLAVQALQQEGCSFYHFPGHHPAIWAPGQRPFYLHGAIHPGLLTNEQEHVVLLTDAIPAQQVEPMNFDDISKLPACKKITLLIDESHSLGILGAAGGGITGGVNLPNVGRMIMTASLGKAMGITGGVIAGDRSFMDQVQKLPSFAGGAGMNPAFAQSLADAAPIVREMHQQLMVNLEYLHSLADLRPWLQFNPQYPILYPKQDGLYEWLLEKGILITHFPYPTAPGG